MKNRLKREVLIIIFLSIIVTVGLNMSIQFVVDRYYDDELDEYILKMVNERKPIDRTIIEKMDDIQFTRSMTINLVSIGICGFLFWIFISKKTKYIKELSNALIYIGEGNLDHTVPLREKNELTDLAESINELTLAFKERMAKEKEIGNQERDFIVGISHDIRTPLTTIIGYMHIIKDQQYETMDERNQYMETIIDRVYQLKELTDLFLSETSNSNIYYSIDLLDSSSFKMKTIDKLRTELKDKFEVITSDNLEQPLRIYVSSMERVIDNMVSNILKYADPKIPIKIDLRRVNDHVKLTIKNGCFEDYSDTVDRFTDRFYRADNSRELTEGHGLGLSICKNIMDSSNGDIKIEAVEKTVTVTLIFLCE